MDSNPIMNGPMIPVQPGKLKHVEILLQVQWFLSSRVFVMTTRSRLRGQKKEAASSFLSICGSPMRVFWKRRLASGLRRVVTLPLRLLAKQGSNPGLPRLES